MLFKLRLIYFAKIYLFNYLFLGWTKHLVVWGYIQNKKKNIFSGIGPLIWFQEFCYPGPRENLEPG